MRTETFKKVVLIILSIFVVSALGFTAFSAVRFFKAKRTFETQNDEYVAMSLEFDKKDSEYTDVILEVKKFEKENENLKAEISSLQSDETELREKVTVLRDEYIEKLGKVCYLTFDDGPSVNTPTLLSVLKENNVKATFFVVGKKPEYLKNLIDDGHTIALHSMTHEWSIYKSEETYYDDLEKISNQVSEYTGITTNIIRFPGGSSNAVSKKYNTGIMTRLTADVQEKGYIYVDWNVDSGDASGKKYSPEQLSQNVLNGAKNKKQICVLMHDTKSKGNTILALPAIIEGLRDMGFKFEMLNAASPVFHAGRLNN